MAPGAFYRPHSNPATVAQTEHPSNPLTCKDMVGCDRLRAVRIVIDYRPALRARTGVGELIHEVARELLRAGGDDITLFSSSWKDRLPAGLSTQLPNARLADRRIPVSA